MPEPLTLYGELRVPAILLPTCQPAASAEPPASRGVCAMSLDPTLWAQLQAHGVCEAHLQMLLRLLEVQRNGWWGWHYVNGQITQCNARLTFASRSYEVERVAAALLDGASVVR